MRGCLAGVAMLIGGFTAASARAEGAATDEQVWGAVSLQGTLSGPFAFFMDAHARVDTDAGSSVSILRPAVGYRLAKGLYAWQGYAWTPSRGALGLVKEQRTWQQLTWAEGFLGRGKLLVRPRLEERFVDASATVGLRFRQLVRVQWGLGRGPFLLALWDEVFVHLRDSDTGDRGGFDQNRLWVGPGVLLSKELRLETGYLWQYVARSGARDLVRHVAAVNLFVAFD